MVFVKVGKVKISRWKLLICKDNTLFSITFELVVQVWCFNFCLKAVDVYFTRRPCFYFWVGSFLLESAENGPIQRSVALQLQKDVHILWRASPVGSSCFTLIPQFLSQYGSLRIACHVKLFTSSSRAFSILVHFKFFALFMGWSRWFSLETPSPWHTAIAFYKSGLHSIILNSSHFTLGWVATQKSTREQALAYHTTHQHWRHPRLTQSQVTLFVLVSHFVSTSQSCLPYTLPTLPPSKAKHDRWLPPMGFLPPASAAEVMESQPSSMSALTAELFDVWTWKHNFTQWNSVLLVASPATTSQFSRPILAIALFSPRSR